MAASLLLLSLKHIFKSNVILTSIIIICLLSNLYSQPNKRTNIWYFGNHLGLDFNSGQPSVLNNGQIVLPASKGCASICDTNGNLLFYTDGKEIWCRNHQRMINGYANFIPGTQAALCIPKPGSDNLFYVFTARYNEFDYPFFYYTIDINLNNGLGEVIDKDTLAAGWDASEKLTGVYHDNKKNIWIITRKFRENNYASFLLTEDGVDPDPVLSQAPDKSTYTNTDPWGYMKVSYDKKYLFACYYGGNHYNNAEVEICSFDPTSGQVNYLYSIILKDTNNPLNRYRPYGIEFSPDSKYLYISAFIYPQLIGRVFQYDMQYIEDSLLFSQSSIDLGIGQGFALQLAPDGKIYCSDNSSQVLRFYIGIIHKPWLRGTDCEFQPLGIDLNGDTTSHCLPNFINDFLYRFDFEGICESDTFYFDPWFFPEPVFIEWNFGDLASGSNNTSTIPHATHVFSDGGTYEVSVYVEYPSGRIEETSREVEVEYAPEPNLGPDTTICIGNDIILNAECGPHFYFWSTGQFGISQITVSDTGWYWVRVTSNAGCFEIDSVHIAFYAPAIADTSNLIISPTTCGGSIGAIRGLTVSGNPPFQY
jgi:hypothetical protein